MVRIVEAKFPGLNLIDFAESSPIDHCQVYRTHTQTHTVQYDIDRISDTTAVSVTQRLTYCHLVNICAAFSTTTITPVMGKSRIPCAKCQIF